jgi:phospholipase C
MTKPPNPHTLPLLSAPRSLMRRQLLRASVAASAASLLGSCMSGSDESALPSLPGATPPYMPEITNLVVVMMENRSFDNMLGFLYADDLAKLPAKWPVKVGLPFQLPAGKSFEGLWQFKGGAAPCTGLQGCNTEPGGKVFVHPHDFSPDSTSATDWSHPNPNPGEGFENTAEQLASGTMNGFLANYEGEVAKPEHQGKDPASTILGSYTPAQAGVLSGLAHEFAVFDHWFCAVPSQTYCNRSFFHASTSSGYVYNAPTKAESRLGITEQSKWATNTAETVFDRLSTTKDPATGLPVTWSVYASSNGTYPKGLTAFIHQRVSSTYAKQFQSLESFCADVAAGSLPRYSFVETLFGGSEDFHPPQDIRGGEEVLRQVYEAIRTSGTGKVDYTRNTMILIVFDEHGGTFDHVAPGAAKAPPKSAAPDSDFNFETLGVRVPAIAISSYTASHTIINTPVNHAAVIRTLKMAHGFPPLNERDMDSSGGDLSLAYNLPVARKQSEWPCFPKPVSPKPINIGCNASKTCGIP